MESSKLLFNVLSYQQATNLERFRPYLVSHRMNVPEMGVLLELNVTVGRTCGRKRQAGCYHPSSNIKMDHFYQPLGTYSFTTNPSSLPIGFDPKYACLTSHSDPEEGSLYYTSTWNSLPMSEYFWCLKKDHVIVCSTVRPLPVFPNGFFFTGA